MVLIFAVKGYWKFKFGSWYSDIFAYLIHLYH